MTLPIHHIHIPVDAESLATRDHCLNCQSLCSAEIAPDKGHSHKDLSRFATEVLSRSLWDFVLSAS